LTAIRFPEALLNPIIRNPKHDIAGEVIESPEREEHILKFELSAALDPSAASGFIMW
jgi:hypothetical protein